eukprot:1988416-Amphidinium_carterae.2
MLLRVCTSWPATRSRFFCGPSQQQHVPMRLNSDASATYLITTCEAGLWEEARLTCSCVVLSECYRNAVSCRTPFN